ncbi:glycosyltransferase family 4 protein [Sagittula sp. S175]|uniref:glycosyltransferase family 4 protein n=1 Tax=Sagittula sp. S175 TaxID=3415129 RepID=UPI003C7EB557
MLRKTPGRWPRALSAGTKGDFARHLETLGWTPDDVATALAGGYEQHVALAIQTVGLDKIDAGQIFRPGHRGYLVRHLFAMVARGQLSLDAAWWTLLALRETPARGWIWGWLLSDQLQTAFPLGVTCFGRKAYLAATGAPKADVALLPDVLPPEDHIRLLWLHDAEIRTAHPQALSDPDAARTLIADLDRRFPDPEVRGWLASIDHEQTAQGLARPGVNVLGHFSYPSGLRVSTLALAQAAQDAGLAVACRNVPGNRKLDRPEGASPLLSPEIHPITIMHVQPGHQFETLHRQTGLAERSPRSYRIGFWYWEFATIPDSFVDAARQCDEVWTATDFVAQALRARLDVPVRAILPSLELPDLPKRTKEDFGLSSERFVFLFTFSMMSVSERKNPLGLIQAFRSAFPPDAAVEMVIKTSFGSKFPEQIAALHEAAKGHRIRIVDELWSYDKVLELTQVADAYVSLHRSEGLGLTMAEAMLSGIPVIATAYSGNMSFMDAQTALLVPASQVEVGEWRGPYAPDSLWGEPDLEAAAAAMRDLVEQEGLARDLGARGQAAARNIFAPARMMQDVDRRIREITAR